MLDKDIQYLKGVGPKRAEKLNRLGIYKIRDLIEYYPIKYEDRRKITKIKDIIEEGKFLLKIKIDDISPIRRVGKKMTLFNISAHDDTDYIKMTFFNSTYIHDKLVRGDIYYVFGKIKKSNGICEISNPEIEKIDERVKSGRIMPIYSLTYALTNNEITKLVMDCLEIYGKDIQNIIPENLKLNYELLDKIDAVKNLHFPKSGADYKLAKKTIAFEKLLILQIGLLSIKSKLNNNNDGLIQNKSNYSKILLDALPFKLTHAQNQVFKEIKKDMSNQKPMNRLVQGDVGSGKTIIAFAAMFDSVESGYQASMMAPTEILAKQHYNNIEEYIKLSNLNIRTAFLAGSTTKKEKEKILTDVKNGEIDILIGTHALIEKNVEFMNIGLVITDEQHRFGVRQRAMLINKGSNPDILVMTATPIPRTLSLMIYGDLDISIIDELPPGRQVIKTKVVSGNEKENVYEFIKNKLNEGRQAYIVAPLVDESEALELDSAVQIFEELKIKYFRGFNVGLLHGKMSNKEKDEIMEQFYAKKIDLLVSTTVIEVGVNVPNAVVMMILNAERFGLAQLHQLRGRVGRGEHQSYCILVNESKTQTAKARMKVLEESNNGFVIAEEDLRLRGPGDFFGTRQHGIENYNLDKLLGDTTLIKEVRSISEEILEKNPDLSNEQYRGLKKEILKLFDDKEIAFN